MILNVGAGDPGQPTVTLSVPDPNHNQQLMISALRISKRAMNCGKVEEPSSYHEAKPKYGENSLLHPRS